MYVGMYMYDDITYLERSESANLENTARARPHAATVTQLICNQLYGIDTVQWALALAENAKTCHAI